MSLYTSLGLIILTVTLYLSALGVNEFLFLNTEFARGINWIYLPAGVRLVCTLLFGGTGAIGVFIASLLATYFYYFPGDWGHTLAGSTSSALAPYLAYRLAGLQFNFRNSLDQLTPGVLTACSVVYAATNALLHHLWLLAFYAVKSPWESVFIMFTGDLLGTFLVLYSIKATLASVRLLLR
jgi:hypothetical protein